MYFLLPVPFSWLLSLPLFTALTATATVLSTTIYAANTEIFSSAETRTNPMRDVMYFPVTISIGFSVTKLVINEQQYDQA